MKISHIVLGVLIGVALTLSGVAMYKATTVSEVMYVDVPKLFNSFDLKKDLSVKLEGVMTRRNEIIDSLQTELKLLENNLRHEQGSDQIMQAYIKKKEELAVHQNRFAELNAQDAQKYDEQIYTQINQYISEYGKEQKCRFILGANGNGSMLYANQDNDITDEVIAYANFKFNGE